MANSRKNNNKSKIQPKGLDREKKSGSQGGRSTYNKGEMEKDSWTLDDESMDNE